MRTRSFLVHCTVLLVLFMCMGQSPVQGADTSSDRERELRRIKQEMQEKKKGLKRAKRKEHSVLVDLDKIDRDIQAGAVELANQQRELRNAEATLQGIETKNAEISRELAGLKRLYAQRLRALYKMQRSGAAIAVVAENPGIAVKQAKYLGLIAERDRVLLQDYGNALDRLAMYQREIERGKKKRSSGESKMLKPGRPTSR